MPRRSAYLLILLTAALTGCRWWRPRLKLVSSSTTQTADGREHQIAIVAARRRMLSADDLHITGAPLWRIRTEDTGSGRLALYFRAPVQPANTSLIVTNDGGRIPLHIVFAPDYADANVDGTPDWMQLHGTEDRRAFRRWFVALADRMADTPDAKLPPEIVDCASLLRYAYRESLRVHDDKWYAQFASEEMPSLPSVRQWSYPNTMLGSGLFRTRPGPFTPGDITNGAFAEFADAKTLHSDNTYLIGRDIHNAKPGDLIFYRLLETDSQYHSMVITGEHVQWVVYHTGPSHGQRGEMRRVPLTDLLHHPDPRWRPEPSNPNFLGVYRWNILRED